MRLWMPSSSVLIEGSRSPTSFCVFSLSVSPPSAGRDLPQWRVCPKDAGGVWWTMIMASWGLLHFPLWALKSPQRWKSYVFPISMGGKFPLRGEVEDLTWSNRTGLVVSLWTGWGQILQGMFPLEEGHCSPHPQSCRDFHGLWSWGRGGVERRAWAWLPVHWQLLIYWEPWCGDQ